MVELFTVLIGSGITVTIGGGFILFLFLHPDKFEHWMAITHRMLYSLTSNIPKIRQKVDRLVVASSIQDSVNGVCEQINRQSPDVLPHALKIEWVHSESPESFIKKGQVIVRLKHYVNQDRNIVDSTLMYLQIGFLPRSRNYLDETLRKCCEFKVATQIFDAKRDTGAYDYFIENELYPAFNIVANLKRDMQILEDMDSVGFFSHVFLTEVKHTGEKLMKTIPTTAVQQELRDFAVFLQTIANKGSSEKVPLGFKGVRVNVAVVLVAKKETIELYGIEPYINAISICVREGYDSIYISGWGEEFTRKVVDIKNEVERNGLITILRRYDPPIRNQVKGTLLVGQSNISHLAQQRELQEGVKRAMDEIVPEIKNAEVEIVSIAIMKGVGCKIAVRMASGDDVFSAVGACIGENSERLTALKDRLSNRFVTIIPWSDNISVFIANALAPRKADYIDTVEIDEENLVANVKVSSKDAYRKALGRNKSNVNLASELTGWVINIEGPKKTRIMRTPDEELKKIIGVHVPEIKNNEIEIVRIARTKGVVSRVIVKWKNEYNMSNRLMASEVCRGRNNEHSKAIKQETTGEWLYFHEWYADPKEQIINCLYPLKKFDVKSIDLDDELYIAIVTLREKTESTPSWRDPYKLALSERVTGWKIKIIESA
jgi:transcription antitermination factor NusA-like protein